MSYDLSYRVPRKPEGTYTTYVREDEDGSMWIDCGLEEIRVNYCPFTGTPAKKQMTVVNREVKDFEGNTVYYKKYVD